MGQLHSTEVGDLRERRGQCFEEMGGSKTLELSQTEKILYSARESNRFRENQFLKNKSLTLYKAAL